jgi:hypothetical protein
LRVRLRRPRKDRAKERTRANSDKTLSHHPARLQQTRDPAGRKRQNLGKTRLLTRRNGGPMVDNIRERRANDSGGHPGLWHRHRPQDQGHLCRTIAVPVLW